MKRKSPQTLGFVSLVLAGLLAGCDSKKLPPEVGLEPLPLPVQQSFMREYPNARPVAIKQGNKNGVTEYQVVFISPRYEKRWAGYNADGVKTTDD